MASDRRIFLATLLLLLHLALSDPRCDPSSVSFQRSFGTCNSELEELYEGSFYKDFLGSPDHTELQTLCDTYMRWLACVKSLAATCKIGEDETEDGLGTAHKLIVHTCLHRRQSTIHNLHCLMSQSRDINPLYKGCYNIMDLKLKAGIFQTCAVAQEYIRCEDRLMRSACGSDLADFTLALSLRHKFSALDLGKECQYNPLTYYDGFVYSMKCPPDFPVRMRKCYDRFLQTRVALYNTMLAVIRGPVESVDDWCSAFIEYDECMEPIVAECPSGVQAVYETENEWHRIIKIANYLCKDGFEDYKRHLPCYKNMLRYTSIFKLCRKVFDKYPTKYEAYSIKCTPNSATSNSNLRKRKKLIECFASFIRRDCGLNASQTIEPLIHMQYSFDYLPPCSNTKEIVCASTSGATYIYNLILPLSFVCLWLVYHIDERNEKNKC